MRFLSLLLVASLATGCATITGGKTDYFNVNSNPPGAEVKVDGLVLGRTPTTVELDKKRAPGVEVSLPGYFPQTCRPRYAPGTGYVIADALMCLLLFPIGCIAFIDAGGAWNELENPSCTVQLQPGGYQQPYEQPGYYPPGYQAPPPGYQPPPGQPQQPQQAPPGYPAPPPPPPPPPSP